MIDDENVDLPDFDSWLVDVTVEGLPVKQAKFMLELYFGKLDWPAASLGKVTVRPVKDAPALITIEPHDRSGKVPT